MRTVVAIDVGGTKLAAGIVDEQGELRARAQAPTPAGDDAEALFGVIAGLIDEVGGIGDAAAVGVGTGGPMTRGGDGPS